MPKRLIDIIIFLLIIFLILYEIFVLAGKDYYLIATAICILGVLEFIISFEKSRPGVEMLTILSTLSAIAIVSRIAFFFLPEVKPIAAIIIITGIAYGSGAGFVVGAISAFVSNFYFGQGSWTPFQMFALGLVGYFAGLFFSRKRKTLLDKKGKVSFDLILILIYSFFSVLIIYGGIVDINSIFWMSREANINMIISIYLSALPFNLIFAISTCIFIFILYKPILKRLDRINNKFNI